MSDIIYRDESYRIMGACFEVYKEKGSGFLEAVYHECLEIEFTDQGLPFASRLLLPLSYKGRSLQQTYAPDFVCFDKIILELKSVSKLADEHRAQVHNYLRATGYRLGVLVNLDIFPRLNTSVSRYDTAVHFVYFVCFVCFVVIPSHELHF